MKRLFLFVLCFAAGSLGLQRAGAQLAPPPAPASPGPAGALPASYLAHNTEVKSSRPTIPGPQQDPRNQANAAPQQPGQTKVVRIYGGAGYFDNALAEKLRPMLAKAFGTSRPDAPKAVPGAASRRPGKR